MVDYKGQALAERYLVLCFVIVCTPAWIVGYLQQDFSVPFRAWVAATLLAALVVLPNWGMYNRNPIKWLSSAMYVSKPKDSKAKDSKTKDSKTKDGKTKTS